MGTDLVLMGAYSSKMLTIREWYISKVIDGQVRFETSGTAEEATEAENLLISTVFTRQYEIVMLSVHLAGQIHVKR